MDLLHSICWNNRKSGKNAIICAETGVVLSYEELNRAVRMVSEELIKIGAAQGRPVVLLFPVSAEYVIAFFSVLSAGCIAAPIDRFTKNSALEHLIGYLNPSLIITNEMLWLKLPKNVIHKYPVITLDATSKKNQRMMQLRIHNKDQFCVLEELSYHAAQVDAFFTVPIPVTPANDAVFITTSGTTGTPKIVRLTHKGIAENIQMHLASMGIHHSLIAAQTLELSYSYGLIASLLSVLYTQGTAILISRLDIPFICSAIKQHNIDFWVGSPSLFRYLIDHFNASIKESLKSLQRITIGGDKCSPALRSRIKEILDPVSIHITYGITEAGPRISTLPSEYLLAKPTSVGLPLKEVRVRIMNNKNEECGPGEIGQVAVQSPSLMAGYYNNEGLTSKVLRNGWFYTGDLGELDDEGFLYVRGRMDNEFKLNGRRINPRVIEECISYHPDIIDAKVSKVEHNGDSYIHADVVSGQTSVSAEELKRHCMKNLPMYMVPGKFKFLPEHEYYFKGKRIL